MKFLCYTQITYDVQENFGWKKLTKFYNKKELSKYYIRLYIVCIIFVTTCISIDITITWIKQKLKIGPTNLNNKLYFHVQYREKVVIKR